MQARGTNIKKSQLDGLAALANASPIPKLKWRFFNRPSASGENSYFLEPAQSQDFQFKDKSEWVESTDSWLAELSRIRANIQRYYSTRQTPVLPATNSKQVKQVGVTNGLKNLPARFLKKVRFISTNSSAKAYIKLALRSGLYSTAFSPCESVTTAQSVSARYKFGVLFTNGNNRYIGELGAEVQFVGADNISSIEVSGPSSSWVYGVRWYNINTSYAFLAFRLKDGHTSTIDITIKVNTLSPVLSLAKLSELFEPYSHAPGYIPGGYWLMEFNESSEYKSISSIKTYSVLVSNECPAMFDSSYQIRGLIDYPVVFPQVEITANTAGYWLADCPMINGLSMDIPARGGVLHPNAYDYGPIPYDTKITGLKVIDYLDRGLHSHISQMIYDQPPLYPWQRDTDTGLSAPNISGRCIYKVVAKRIATEKSGSRGSAITVEIGCIQGGTFNTFETVTIDANKPASDAIYPNWIIFDTSRIAYRCAQKVEIYASVYEPINIAQSDWPYGFRLSGPVLADWLNDTEAILQSIT